MKVYNKSEWETGKLKLKNNAIPLLETDGQLDIGEAYKINGHLYSVCVISPKENYVVVRELNVLDLPSNPEDQDFTDEIVCPYCESALESFEMADEEDDYECPYCNSHFSYQRIISVEYCSQPVRKGNVIELN